MNLSLLFRSQLQTAGEVGNAILRNFELLVSSLTSWGQIEHNDDGTHADVTATSVTADDLIADGPVRFNRMVTYTNLGVIPTGRINNLYTPGLETANVLKVRIAAVGVTLTGIYATGRRKGDLLLLINDDLHVAGPGPDFGMAAANANSEAANRFIGSLASRTPWTLQASEAVLLMYDEYANTTAGATFPGWRVVTGVV